ncbi:MAG: DUF983 domain-containing protein [Phycisphaerales bacterium]|nr:DUF983 domain-containing protein [Hyphomonadaceae bacterium]
MNAAPSPWAAGLQLRCPQCGKGAVFQGYLKFRDACRVCGADFKAADAGDGPAVFVILVVGAIIAPLLIILQFGLDLPGWLALTITMIAAVALCLAFLPPFKALLFAFQWKHKAREATLDDIE